METGQAVASGPLLTLTVVALLLLPAGWLAIRTTAMMLSYNTEYLREECWTKVETI